jgi:hypothetical protein
LVLNVRPDDFHHFIEAVDPMLQLSELFVDHRIGQLQMLDGNLASADRPHVVLLDEVMDKVIAQCDQLRRLDPEPDGSNCSTGSARPTSKRNDPRSEGAGPRCAQVTNGRVSLNRSSMRASA